MKLTYKISRMAQVLIASCCLVSCNYLDVIPPAQADFKDTMKDEEATLSFLYTCYGGATGFLPLLLYAFLAVLRVLLLIIIMLLSSQLMRLFSLMLTPTGSNKWRGELFLRHIPTVGEVMI